VARAGAEGPSLVGSAMAQGRRRSLAPVAAVQCRAHESPEAGRGTADRRLQPAVDHLGSQHVPGPQAGPDAAALIDPAQWVLGLRQARGNAVNLRAKPAHRQEHAPSHLNPEDLRDDETRARDVDPQPRSGGMVPELPSWLMLQSRGRAGMRSNTCFGDVSWDNFDVHGPAAFLRDHRREKAEQPGGDRRLRAGTGALFT
jgi:hypothetical protein